MEFLKRRQRKEIKIPQVQLQIADESLLPALEELECDPDSEMRLVNQRHSFLYFNKCARMLRERDFLDRLRQRRETRGDAAAFQE